MLTPLLSENNENESRELRQENEEITNIRWTIALTYMHRNIIYNAYYLLTTVIFLIHEP